MRNISRYVRIMEEAMGKTGRHKRTRRSLHKSRKQKFAEPKTLQEYLAMPDGDQDLWDDVGHIVTDVRAGTASVTSAAAKYSRNRKRVLSLAKRAFRKSKSGRWTAKKSDRLLRVLQVLTPEGREQIGLTDSRRASLLGKYWVAVERYRDTGDDSGLRKLKGKHVVDATGKRWPLLTDLDLLNRLGSAGELSFETFYGRVA
jgi:hypothetical protein